MLLLLLERKRRENACALQSFAKPNPRLARISHEVLLECDVASHRFRYHNDRQ